jgi:hypothetical protein
VLSLAPNTQRDLTHRIVTRALIVIPNLRAQHRVRLNVMECKAGRTHVPDRTQAA